MKLFTKRIFSFVIILFAVSLISGPTVNAIGFIQFKPMIFNLKALSLKGIFTLKFNRTLMTNSILSCPLVRIEAEREYNRCAGLLDRMDQAGHAQLLEAKNAAVYGCELPSSKCFGLDIIPSDDELQSVLFPMKAIELECLGPPARDCTLLGGQTGIQKVTTCNTLTGEWSWGACEPILSIEPINRIEVEINPVCTMYLYSNWSLCLNGTQSRTLVAKYPTGCTGEAPGPFMQSCNPLLPICTSFTYGEWGTCVNGIQTREILSKTPTLCAGGNPVTSQSCASQSNCPALDPNYRVCMMPDGRYGREYTDYCNESTGEWVWKACNVYINLQPTCTSFTYTDWTTCSSSGGQTRTILTREPYGCAGGSPITYQTCCLGAEPSCAAGWLGSYTCSGGTWWNTCFPPEPDYCYRGVKYRIFNGRAWAQCVGMKASNNCMINRCSTLQQYNDYNSENSFKTYVDTIYSQTIPNSCDPNFVYTQC